METDFTSGQTESLRILKLFSDQYHGKPWTEVRLIDILNGISAQMAAEKPISNANNIWQLVQHITAWRENVLRKMNGEKLQTPSDNYLSRPDDTSEEAWKNLLDKLEQSEKQWEAFLINITDEKISEPYLPSNGEFTIYEVIQGLLHHDAYHFGQILMLKKLLMQ